MANLGFYFDATRCIGCHTCQIACKDRNRIMEPGILLRTVYSYEAGEYPSSEMYHYPATCNHCESPLCVANCPTGAMYAADDGTVQCDSEACIGCQTCISACPYGIPRFFEEKGIAGKCDSCKDLRDAGMNPACVDACPLRALDFGERDELKEKHGSDLVSETACWPDGGTGPKTLIKAKPIMHEVDYREIIL